MSFWSKVVGNSSSSPASPSNNGLNWQILDSLEGLEAIIEASKEKPQVIFKHSTRCSISSMVKRSFENEWNSPEGEADIHYLDLITYRPVSNQIAQSFGVVHQSPQILVIKDGRAVYHTSHNDISAETVAAIIK